jgi:hypothetical protein
VFIFKAQLAQRPYGFFQVFECERELAVAHVLLNVAKIEQNNLGE